MAVGGKRDPGGEVERDVEVVAVENVVATELFLRVDEGAVGCDRLAVAHADDGCRRARLQRLPPSLLATVSA